MPGPTTVAEYLAQVPNPSPCPHGGVTDPPCTACIQRRITTANALRAGTDPSVALGLTKGPNGGPSLEQGTPLPAQPEPAPQAAAPAPTPPHPKSQAQPPDPTAEDDAALAALLNAATDEAAAMIEAQAAPAEPNPLVPGMTRTEPQQIQPEPPTQVVPAAELLANLTGGTAQPGAPGIETTPPQVVDEGLGPRTLAPLELSPEQVQRRNEIEAGIHPAVALVSIEPQAVEPAVGSSEDGREGPPPPPEPRKEADPKYLQTQRNSVGQLYGWTGTEWELIDFAPPSPPEPASQEPTTPAVEPVVTPPAAEAPVVAEAPQEQPAGPAQVAMNELSAHCEHGMPATDFSTTPPRSASCTECMMNSEGPPPAMSQLKASRFQLAHLSSTCARAMCNRTIERGEVIGLVDNVGWCCATCTKPAVPTTPHLA